MSNELVLIVGAGPTGLVLALWLTRLGVHVRIIDKAPEPGTTSRAVAVQARTLELYRQVNISDAIVGGGVQVAAANLWVRGAQVARLPLGRLGEGLSPFPYALTYPQDAHERLLIERLNALSVRVERRTELLRSMKKRTACGQCSDGRMGQKKSVRRRISLDVTAHRRSFGRRSARASREGHIRASSTSPT
jgi:2-polyprenyl-6-methoxyphenol hydroxylase-like FAD-dependent oxidoreductase